MWWYVGKRLLQTIPVFLGATLILFILLKLRPGDPILNLAGNKPVSQEVRDALAAQYHLDDPLFVQWIQFVKNAITFNFGETFSGQPVFDLISQAQTLLLTDLPAVPLWYQNATAATGKDVKGFEFNWQQKPDYYKLTK